MMLNQRKIGKDRHPLNRSDHIRLVQKIAKQLDLIHSYTDIDLIFGEFGLPTLDQWSDDKYSYCVEQLRHASNDTLLQIHNHLFPDAELGQFGSVEQTGNWKPMYFRLFMSHSSDDKTLVGQVKDELLLFGIDSFVAHMDIEPTKEWMSEIEAALASCDALVAFLSMKFRDSKWCDQEVGYVLSRKRVIVPIRLGVDPYGFMGRYQGMQGSHLTAECLAQQVYDILRSNPKTTDAITRAYEQQRDDAIISRFEISPSYNAAKRNAKRLEEVQRWTPELLGRIERAVGNNIEVANAYGVRAAVSRIVEQYRPAVASLPVGTGDDLPF